MLTNSEIVWSFETARHRITLTLTLDPNYRYNGDDEDGEIQRKLDEGEYVAFDSCVTVERDGKEIGHDYLGGSVYSAFDCHEFWQGHRDRNPLNRNCSLNKYVVGHYFPDMVREAIKDARANLKTKTA